ncbi:magnesium transporter [Polaromonas sp. DSR2-3-2]|uniref:magnesium transporter n=1 Tax=Polaromonas sp. DSR2-3-2 TaxID=2804622 RepID=UPI003CF12503
MSQIKMPAVPLAAPPGESSADRIGPHALRADYAETAEVVRQRIRQQGLRGWDLVCVVDGDGRLLGTLTASELLALPDATALGTVAARDGPTVLPGADQELMASIALHHHVAVMPVVDEAGRLVGVVGPTTLMDILRREHVEDLHRLAGITRESDHARQAIEEPPLRRARHRLPWLVVGLGGSMVATFIVTRFESALAVKPAIAFFVPGLVYLADAIGTQSEAVAVRGLSLSHLGLNRLIGGELRTGILIGMVLALLAFPMVWLVFDELRLAAAVTLALAAASIVASTLGLLLPWLLARFKFDPAYGSGPLATIVQDVLSLLIYFACVSVIVL